VIKRLLLAAVITCVLSTTATGVAVAKDLPSGNGDDGTAVPTQLPTNPDQKASFDRKLAYVAALEQKHKSATKGAVSAAVAVYGSVSTTPRTQETYYYCGPTAIQVISDYSWNVFKKYSQTSIAGQAGTTTGGTGITGERAALMWAIDGSPKGDTFWYAAVHPSNGDAFSHYLQADVILDEMPLVMNLTPWAWDPTNRVYHYLVDWSNKKSFGGHYIVGSGVNGDWDGTYGPQVRFDDGTAGYGGGTGAYWDTQYDVYYLISHWYNWIIW
jgi:hypothetical protein